MYIEIQVINYSNAADMGPSTWITEVSYTEMWTLYNAPLKDEKDLSWVYIVLTIEKASKF